MRGWLRRNTRRQEDAERIAMLEAELRDLQSDYDMLHAWVCSFAPVGFPPAYRPPRSSGTVTLLRPRGPRHPKHARRLGA